MPLSNAMVQRLIAESKRHKCSGKSGICVRIVAIANLPTIFGRFQVVAFSNNADGKDHSAFVHGDVLGRSNVPVRIHSECLTGDAIGSMRCDCRDQLQSALKIIGKSRCGVLLYLRQEGRGIGLANKIKAYQLQDRGYDTFEANEALGFKRDERNYEIAAHMLRLLKVRSIRLMTNNPDKISNLTKYGVKITGRIPLIIPPNRYDRFYLETKMKKGGHLLDSHQTEIF